MPPTFTVEPADAGSRLDKFLFTKLGAASRTQVQKLIKAGAAIEGRVDELRGLKENVIIGQLIPVGTGFGAKEPRSPVDGKGEV